MLFNFHLFVSFSNFSMLRISNFIPLRPAIKLSKFFLIEFTEVVLWPRRWFTLGRLPRVLEKNVCSVTLGGVFCRYLLDRLVLQCYPGVLGP